ncbi:carboxylate--amine ligase [Demequina pelophila]|uniref:carboxylate--amine ligase n=1 Tax=Demequina pelophila TaxID=1638984 RepID=UPI000AFF6306|nr:carboxylate--amine ligase [Demequina pelophila]
MTILPVVVGGDIGAYAMVRAFHEAFGATSVVLAKVVTRPFEASRLAEVRVADVEDEAALVAALEQVAADHPSSRRVLLTNADWYVGMINANRDRLEPLFDIALCSADNFDRVSSKERFQQDCEALGIPVPATVHVRPGDGVDDATAAALDALTFPVVGKPSSSAEYHYVEFAGKLKVHHLDSREEVDALIAKLAGAGFTGTFLFQEFIPGDETHMRSLTAYRSAQGRVTLLATGRVLLEEHTPGTLGIPAAILTEPYADAMDAMSRYLEHIDYRGFANADFKLDPRTGRHVFFEVNPRIGRNNWYVTAAGANVAEHVVADLEGRAIEPVRVDREVLYTVVPVRLLLRYLPDVELRRRVEGAAIRALARPLMSPADRALRRMVAVWGMTLNHYRKYKRHYPEYTATGF